MPIYEYLCGNDHVTEFVCKFHEREETIPCRQCNKWGLLRISKPTIHTLSTHFAGTGMSYGDDYLDENLCDPTTRKPMVVTSLNDKRRKLKAAGLYEKGTLPARTKALKRAVSVYHKPSGQAA
jgi:predicted nucleic acid-binding Zn ribbon protein